MARRLPNLNQLRAFEAAARHGSFKDAAEELNVTQAAVSQQIRALEDHLGLQLFVRRTRKVHPTEAARSYSARLGHAFDEMNEATRALETERMAGTLHISVPPYASDRLLMPRLARFHAAHPNLAVVPLTDAAQVDLLHRPDLDAAVRYGTGDWDRMDAIRLHRTYLAPIASPALVEGQPLPLTPESIARLPLGCIEGYEAEWEAWFAAAGLEIESLSVTGFGSGTRAVDIAFSGQHAVLISTLVIAEDVESGELVRLSPVSVETARAFHVVWPSTSYPDPRVLAFAHWFRDELAAQPGFDG